jgi:hypothetical protein
MSFRLFHLSIKLKTVRILFASIQKSSDPIVTNLDGSPFQRNAPFLLDPTTHSAISFEEFLDCAWRTRTEDWPFASHDDGGIKHIRIDLPSQRNFVRTLEGVSPIDAIEIEFTGGVTQTPMRLNNALNYVSNNDGTLARFTDWSCTTVNGKGETVITEF